MKKASSVLIPYKGSFLVVSRKDNSELWGMPGGKVEGNESWLDAAIRELYEETRIIAKPQDLTPIYQYTSAGDVQYTTTTFLLDMFKSLKTVNSAIPEAGTQVGLLTREELESPRFSPFAKYNQAMFQAYDKYMENYTPLSVLKNSY